MNTSRLAGLALSLLAATAGADDGPTMAGLLCAPLANAAQKSFLAYVAAHGAQDGDGVIRLRGPVQAGGLCLRDVTLVGVFGVFMSTGESCSPTADDFVRAVAAQPGLARLPSAPARTLAAFEIANGERDKGGLVVFQGEPAMQAAPDPAAGKVSYTCSRQDGGAQ